ncbi:hypothetical protein CYLTODRAFT_453744, partial [Cylindrobasidium torrendii FP15055 ss-10]
MRLESLFYFLFSLVVAVNALDAGARSNGAGVAVKDAESQVSKIAKDVRDEAAKAAQSVGAFIDEQIQAGFAGEIKNKIKKTISTANDFKKYLDEHDIGVDELHRTAGGWLAWGGCAAFHAMPLRSDRA